MSQKTRFNLTVPRHTPEGMVVGHLMYHGVLRDLIKRDEYSGCPHDGGSHTLWLEVTQADLEAFLDLIDGVYLPLGGKYAEGVVTLRKMAMTRDKWKRMTDEELKSAIRQICRKCNSADDVNKMAKEELGYPYTIAVAYGLRDMVMANFYGKGGTLTL